MSAVRGKFELLIVPIGNVELSLKRTQARTPRRHASGTLAEVVSRGRSKAGCGR